MKFIKLLCLTCILSAIQCEEEKLPEEFFTQEYIDGEMAKVFEKSETVKELNEYKANLKHALDNDDQDAADIIRINVEQKGKLDPLAKLRFKQKQILEKYDKNRKSKKDPEQIQSLRESYDEYGKDLLAIDKESNHSFLRRKANDYYYRSSLDY